VGVDWFHVAQDTHRWRALVNTVISQPSGPIKTMKSVMLLWEPPLVSTEPCRSERTSEFYTPTRAQTRHTGSHNRGRCGRMVLLLIQSGLRLSSWPNDNPPIGPPELLFLVDHSWHLFLAYDSPPFFQHLFLCSEVLSMCNLTNMHLLSGILLIFALPLSYQKFIWLSFSISSRCAIWACSLEYYQLTLTVL
jgi:hypothetical protein